jgi:hypothetical protein
LRNWTEVEGNTRPYATEIFYTCTREGWGYPSSGLNRNIISIHTCNETMKKYFFSLERLNSFVFVNSKIYVDKI